ncbi:MAG TPA: ATP-binding protein [Anaeromyxobacter sp.]|nr:ATP-binding protein [Anaeromyxobacter sp.]
MAGPSHPDLRILFGIFLAVAALFTGANAYSQYALERIDAASDEIAYNSAPSMAHLAALRSAVRQVQLLVERSARTPAVEDDAEAEQALAQVNSEARAYLGLPRFPGEQAVWHEVERALDEFDRAVHREVAQRTSGAAGLAQGSLDEVARSADRLMDAAAVDIEFNANNGRDLALRIKAVRSRAAWIGWLLDGLCFAFAIAAGRMVLRQVRRYGDLVDRHATLQEQRASELEKFAGRAAHDILNPVAATQMALQLAAQRSPPDAPARDLVERALRNVARVRTIVDGLLQFARAGARPSPGARALLAAVVDDVAGGVRPAAERAGVELRVEPLPPAAVACSPGVLTSLVSNLVHNAIKYAGVRAGASITVRARDARDAVRVEVEDTGPGIPPDALQDIFLPYVRGPTGGRDGLGLGLATVRRLAEAHGGRAGVRSVLGEGSTFWFELPRAGAVSRAETVRPAGAEPSRAGPAMH